MGTLRWQMVSMEVAIVTVCSWARLCFHEEAWPSAVEATS